MAALFPCDTLHTLTSEAAYLRKRRVVRVGKNGGQHATICRLQFLQPRDLSLVDLQGKQPVGILGPCSSTRQIKAAFISLIRKLYGRNFVYMLSLCHFNIMCLIELQWNSESTGKHIGAIFIKAFAYGARNG